MVRSSVSTSLQDRRETGFGVIRTLAAALAICAAGAAAGTLLGAAEPYQTSLGPTA